MKDSDTFMYLENNTKTNIWMKKKIKSERLKLHVSVVSKGENIKTSAEDTTVTTAKG